MDDLFPGFSVEPVPTGAGPIHVRRGGSGPPLLLLHGFPQTGAMWARVAAGLTDRFEVIVPDLPGYGASETLRPGPERMAKRVLAEDMDRLMDGLGHGHYAIAGHDRGGRVAYRLALDMPHRVSRLAVLDILPTADYWAGMDRAFALKVYHWPFLAQPAPLPETLIGGAPDFYVDTKLAAWTAAKDLSCFDPRALEAYRDNARDPLRLAAMCDDYRAGAGIDVEHDEADRAAGRRIEAPLLALWGAAGIARNAATPLESWRAWGADVRGQAMESGHFIPEEAPDATIAALAEFFG